MFCRFPRQTCVPVSVDQRSCRAVGGNGLARYDLYSVSVDANDFQIGALAVRSFIRPNRLFTVEQSVILYTAARLSNAKLDETLAKLRQLFS